MSRSEAILLKSYHTNRYTETYSGLISLPVEGGSSVCPFIESTVVQQKPNSITLAGSELAPNQLA